MKVSPLSLTEGSITRSIVSFSLPILFSNLLQQVYNSVDSAILGHCAGSGALAAAGSVGALFNLLVGFSLGLATGVNILYAIHYGAGDHKALKTLIHNALLVSVMASGIITLIGIVFADPLLMLINTPVEVYPPSKSYLVILSTGVIATILYNVGAGMIRAEGDSLTPLIYLCIGGLVNLVLDWLFVAKLDFGIAGAAWATVFAQGLTAVLVLQKLTRLNPAYALHFRQLAFHKNTVGQILKLSIPCGLQSSMFNISNLLVQAKINAFGAVTMAGFTAYGKVDSFVYMPILAISSALSTYVGQNKGAGQYVRMRQGIQVSLYLAIGTTTVISMIVLFFAAPLIGLFTNDPSAIALGVQVARYLMPFVWLYPVSDILGGAVRGFGQSAPVTAISAVCICLFRILWLEILFLFQNDIRIIFLCYPVSWWLCVLAMVWYYFRHSQIHRVIRACSS